MRNLMVKEALERLNRIITILERLVQSWQGEGHLCADWKSLISYGFPCTTSISVDLYYPTLTSVLLERPLPWLQASTVCLLLWLPSMSGHWFLIVIGQLGLHTCFLMKEYEKKINIRYVKDLSHSGLNNTPLLPGRIEYVKACKLSFGGNKTLKTVPIVLGCVPSRFETPQSALS